MDDEIGPQSSELDVDPNTLPYRRRSGLTDTNVSPPRPAEAPASSEDASALDGLLERRRRPKLSAGRILLFAFTVFSTFSFLMGLLQDSDGRDGYESKYRLISPRDSRFSRRYREARRTLDQWKDEIARMWRFRKSNGITEGFHRKMKLIQRRAYGFRNFENYRVRVRVLCA